MIFDVAVLGGGPAGAAAAIALRQRGRSVVLLERSTLDEWRPGELLSPQARDALIILGVWDRFTALGPAPAHAIHVAWGTPEPYERDALLNAWGHGWTLDRQHFNKMLLAAAADAGANIHLGARPELRGEPGHWQLTVPASPSTSSASKSGSDEHREFTARTLLDATGRTARIARTRGAEWRAHDRLVGVVARTPPAATDPVLVIEAAEHGWWYSAPLPDGTIVVALMTDADLHTGPAFFHAELARTTLTRARLAAVPRDLPLHVRPAGSGRLLPASGPGWRAIGDAASTWDPLSGDGISRALQSGLTAADHLAGDGISRALQSGLTAADNLPDDGISSALRSGLTADNLPTSPNLHTFDQYLDARATHYLREQRWPHALFWRRRHAPPPAQTPLTLDPTATLHWPGTPPTQAPEAEALLAPAELTTLCTLCTPARPAADIVRAFRPHAPYRDDQRVIAALQRLLSAGVLTRL